MTRNLRVQNPPPDSPCFVEVAPDSDFLSELSSSISLVILLLLLLWCLILPFLPYPWLINSDLQISSSEGHGLSLSLSCLSPADPGLLYLCLTVTLCLDLMILVYCHCCLLSPSPAVSVVLMVSCPAITVTQVCCATHHQMNSLFIFWTKIWKIYFTHIKENIYFWRNEQKNFWNFIFWNLLNRERICFSSPNKKIQFQTF